MKVINRKQLRASWTSNLEAHSFGWSPIGPPSFRTLGCMKDDWERRNKWDICVKYFSSPRSSLCSSNIIKALLLLNRRLHKWLKGKESACNAGDTGDVVSIPGFGKIPWRRAWLPTPAFLRGESHGQRWATIHGAAKSQTQLKQLSNQIEINLLII